MSPSAPRRGEVWQLDFDPVIGHEQAGRRPALVVSDNDFNRMSVELCVVIPLSTTLRAVALHVLIQPPEGGCRRPSAILCEHMRSLSRDRLEKKLGAVSQATMVEIELRMRTVLALREKA